MIWKARLTVYVVGFLGIIAAIATMFDLGTYDSAAGLFYPEPIDLKAMAGFIVAAIGNLLAFFAVIRNWKSRD